MFVLRNFNTDELSATKRFNLKENKKLKWIPSLKKKKTRKEEKQKEEKKETKKERNKKTQCQEKKREKKLFIKFSCCTFDRTMAQSL